MYKVSVMKQTIQVSTPYNSEIEMDIQILTDKTEYKKYG